MKRRFSRVWESAFFDVFFFRLKQTYAESGNASLPDSRFFAAHWETLGCRPNLLGDFIPKPHLRFALFFCCYSSLLQMRVNLFEVPGQFSVFRVINRAFDKRGHILSEGLLERRQQLVRRGDAIAFTVHGFGIGD